MSTLAYSQVSDFIKSTKEAQSNARSHACTMGQLLVGNLDACDHNTLVAMKRELSRFNIRTGRWNKK